MISDALFETHIQLDECLKSKVYKKWYSKETLHIVSAIMFFMNLLREELDTDPDSPMLFSSKDKRNAMNAIKVLNSYIEWRETMSK